MPSRLSPAAPLPAPGLMKLNRVFFQRLFLAFTTGLFLSCAARVSHDQAGSPGVSMSMFPAP